jgi:hypothetical protein
VIANHIAAMRYGQIDAGIASWWGQGSTTDQRFPALLAGANGTDFKWTVYYEQEGTSDPSVAQIQSDLTYLRDHYAADPHYLRIGGRFVVFVYGGGESCATADRWQQANTVGAYVVLKVFSGYRDCANQPDSWHQYAPSSATDRQPGYSYSISPGFWKAGEPVRLERDLARWQQNVQDMVASGEPFQLITTFNEWGEGTATESASEWASPSGYGAYLDALHGVCAIQFSDVGATNPFYSYVRCLACQGVVSGYPDGTFRWGTPVTRGQLAKILSNVAGFSDTIAANQQTFEDIPPTQTFWLWVERLTLHGAISGYPCGGPAEPCGAGNRPYFRPNNNATRAQIARIAAVAAQIQDPVPSTQQTFADVPPGNAFWQNIEQLAARGVISGYPCGGPLEPCVAPANRPYFRPGSATTRGQMAKVAVNTFSPDCTAAP